MDCNDQMASGSKDEDITFGSTNFTADATQLLMLILLLPPHLSATRDDAAEKI
jgi:hypothetical protein